MGCDGHSDRGCNFCHVQFESNCICYLESVPIQDIERWQKAKDYKDTYYKSQELQRELISLMTKLRDVHEDPFWDHCWDLRNFLDQPKVVYRDCNRSHK